MSSKPKIIVLHMKEIVYTFIFASFILLLVFLLIFMFSGEKNSDKVANSSKYVPGVYSSSITVNGTPMNIQLTVDEDNITSIDLIHTDDAITTMYPLIQNSIEDISNQVVTLQDTKKVICPEESKYTYNALLGKIDSMLDTAKATK